MKRSIIALTKVNFYDELESDLKLVFNPFGESSREPIDIKHSKLFTLFFFKDLFTYIAEKKLFKLRGLALKVQIKLKSGQRKEDIKEFALFIAFYNKIYDEANNYEVDKKRLLTDDSTDIFIEKAYVNSLKNEINKIAQLVVYDI